MPRRASATLFLLTLLLAMLGGAPSVSAQDATEHPAVGTWMIQTSNDEPPQIAVVIPGGIVIDASFDGTGYGSWAATGERTADVTFLFPLSGPDGSPAGFNTVRSSIEVAEDGQTFSGTFTLEFPAEMTDALGVPAGQLGPGDVTGQRIAVEAMGEPVGPLPPAGGSDEAAVPPTPEASPAA